MSGFAQGFRTGLDERQRDIDNRRAAELHQLQVEGLRRAAERDRQVDAAYADYSKVSEAGMASPATAGALNRTYGMTPEQATALGTGLQDRLREYDQPDSYDLQTTPQGSDTAYQASVGRGLDVGATRQRELLAARQKINAASRNAAGLAAGEAEGRQIDLNEKMRRVMPMLKDELFRNKLDSYINDNSPGVTVVREPGKPPVVSITQPGMKARLMPLSDAQYMQLGFAHILAAEGDVASAQKLMQSVNKELADAIAGNNKLTVDVARSEQDAWKAAEDAKYRQDHLAAQKEHWRNIEKNQRAGNAAAHPQLSPEMKQKLGVALDNYHSALASGNRELATRFRTEYNALLQRASLDLGRPPAIDTRPPRPPIEFKDWAALVMSNPNAPSPFNDGMGKPVPVGKLNPQQLMQLYDQAVGGGSGGGEDGLPDVPPAQKPAGANQARKADNAAEARGLPTPNARPLPDWAYGNPNQAAAQVLKPMVNSDHPVGQINRQIYERLFGAPAR